MAVQYELWMSSAPVQGSPRFQVHLWSSDTQTMRAVGEPVNATVAELVLEWANDGNGLQGLVDAIRNVERTKDGEPEKQT